jgi:hypothetical protein
LGAVYCRQNNRIFPARTTGRQPEPVTGYFGRLEKWLNGATTAPRSFRNGFSGIRAGSNPSGETRPVLRA